MAEAISSGGQSDPSEYAQLSGGGRLSGFVAQSRQGVRNQLCFDKSRADRIDADVVARTRAENGGRFGEDADGTLARIIGRKRGSPTKPQSKPH